MRNSFANSLKFSKRGLGKQVSRDAHNVELTVRVCHPRPTFIVDPWCSGNITVSKSVDCSSILYGSANAAVAQLVERLPEEQGVVGSSPTGGTKEFFMVC